MSKTTIRSVLDKHFREKAIDYSMYEAADREYLSLTRCAESLKTTNPSLRKRFTESSSNVTERNFDRNLVKGYEHLYTVLNRKKTPPEIWVTFTVLLKLKQYEQQQIATQRGQIQRTSTAEKNGKQRLQNGHNPKTAVKDSSHNYQMSHEQPISHKQQHHSFPTPQTQQKTAYHQSIVAPHADFMKPNTDIVHELQRHVEKLKEENKKLKDDALVSNQEKEGLQRLKRENNDLKLALTEKKEHVDELTTRLSRYTSQQLTQGNPNIADLSDANRPTKIGEKFSAVYDDEWSDAFEILKFERKSEEEIVLELAKVAQDCLEFAETTKRKIIEDIIQQSMNHMVDPYHSEGSVKVNKSSDMGKGHHAMQQRYAKDFMKLHASLSIPNLKKEFVSRRRFTADKMKNYAEVLVELTWLMVVQDPPMMLQFINPGDKINDKTFKVYQRSGKIAKICVWPALFLHENGPVVAKGFALPKT